MNNKCTLAIVIRNNSIPRDNIKVGTHTSKGPCFVSTHGHALIKSKKQKIQNELQIEKYVGTYMKFVCCLPLE